MTFTLDARRISRSVQFDHYGPADDLRVVDVPRPSAGDGQVLVSVVAAVINPGEIAVRLSGEQLAAYHDATYEQTIAFGAA
jgi:NADPH:quinone reductase-like Zn-dependent oxidoreductase